MNIRSVSVLVICFISSFASINSASFLPWGSSSSDDNAQNEKPQISLSCLLYGDAGCSKTCQLTALLYGCDTKPECRDNLYCFCNEVYHTSSGDLTTSDFQKMPFDELWDNTFENTSQANAIRRYIKKNDEMSALVDSLIRDPRVNGEEIKNQLMFKYPNLSSEFKKLISVKRGMKSDWMTGDHLKYEDILDHFNELVTGIQNSDNELQNIKYRHRISKILDSIQDENELGHLVDLVKLSHDESLYNYVTTVLKKRGYVFDNNESNYVPTMGIYSSGSANDFYTTNVIREHNLGVNDINEGDMIELSVITNLAQPSSEDTLSLSQIITNDNNYEQNGVRATTMTTTQSQIPNAAAYDTDVATIEMQTPNAAYTDGTSQAQTASVAYPEIGLPSTPQGQTSNAVYAEAGQPINENENDMFSLSNAVAKIQSDLAALDSEVSQLKSASLGVDLNALSDMLNSGNLAAQANSAAQFNPNPQFPQLNMDLPQFPQLNMDLNGQSLQIPQLNMDLNGQSSQFSQLNVDLNGISSQFPQLNMDLNGMSSQFPELNIDINGMSQALDNSFTTQQNSNFEDNVASLMNTLLGSSAVGTPEASEIEFLNKIPMYMAQVAATPVTFPDGVTVSKVVSSSVPAITPSAIENSVQYTISKKIRKMSDGESTASASPTVDEIPNVVEVATYNSAPSTASTTTTTVEEVFPAQIQITANEPNPDAVDEGKIDTTNSMIVNGNFPSKTVTRQSSPSNTPTSAAAKQTKSSSTTQRISVPTNVQSTKNQVAKKAKAVATNTNTPKTQTTTTETVKSINSPAEATKTNTPKTQTTTTATATSTNSPTESSKVTKMRKTSSSVGGKEVESSQAAAAAAAALVDTTSEKTIMQALSSSDTASSFDSQVNMNKVEEEAPTVVQSVSNVKKKKPQVSQNKKNGDQMETSVRSMSLTETENQMDDSTVSAANTESTQLTSETTQTTMTTTQTSTQSSTILEENTNSALDEVVEEKVTMTTPPSLVAPEPSSPFGRFGLDPIRRFANSFKKSSSP